jgi:hypothetical protein
MFCPDAGSLAIWASLLKVFYLCRYAPKSLLQCRSDERRSSYPLAAADRQHRQECLCHILLMSWSKPTIISQPGGFMPILTRQ